jgi:hypothetical protein
MPFEINNPALLNLLIQSLLLAAVALAAYIARVRGNFTGHCNMLRVAVPVQILTVLFLMTPSMRGFLGSSYASTLLKAEILLHHALGLVVIGAWLYANLVLLQVIKTRGSLVAIMRLALASWLISYGLGVHLYFSIYGF